MGIVLAIIGFILKLFGFKRNVTPAPSAEAVQAKQAGSDETALAVETTSNAEIQKTSDARADVAAATATDDGVHDYAQTDSNNRSE